MSVFVIKLLAIASMLIDHLATYLRARLLISGDLYAASFQKFYHSRRSA